MNWPSVYAEKNWSGGTTGFYLGSFYPFSLNL